MSTIYDVYPFSTESLPEFTHMHELPRFSDIDEFVTAAHGGLARATKDGSIKFESQGSLLYRETDLWLPEGVVAISYVADVADPDHIGKEVPYAIEVGLAIGEELRSPTVSRSVDVIWQYTKEQKDIFASNSGDIGTIGIDKLHHHGRYKTLPYLIDGGVQDYTTSLDFTEDILALRHDEAPDHLPALQGGSLTEDESFAELRQKTHDLSQELIETGEMDTLVSHLDTDAQVHKTLCSKRTLNRLTELLLRFV